MATSFAALKKSRKNTFEKLTKKLEETSGGYSNPDDDKYWQPTVDDAGNGSAVIRFLDSPQGEDFPYVQLWTHGFKNEDTGMWYIENCRTTLKEDDPVVDYNSKLWNEIGTDDAKSQARNQKRRLSFHSNILVVSDPKKPENEGKVFLYRYGKKIFEKIEDAMKPKFEDEEAFNPFDLWEGANLKLKITKVEGYRNYDKSIFETPAPVSNDDDEIERIWNQCNSLQELVAPEKFKSYDELQAKLYKVLGLEYESPEPQREAKKEEPKPKAEPKKEEQKVKEEVDDELDISKLVDDDDDSLPNLDDDSSGNEEDDMMELFKNMAADS